MFCCAAKAAVAKRLFCGTAKRCSHLTENEKGKYCFMANPSRNPISGRRRPGSAT